MCVICQKDGVAHYIMSGLSGKICSSCRDSVLKIRRGNVISAENYFNNLSTISQEGRNFIEKEIELASQSSTNDFSDASHFDEEIIEKNMDDLSEKLSTDLHDSSIKSSPNLMQQLCNDIKIIKNILIFFFILTCVSIVFAFAAYSEFAKVLSKI